MTVQDIKEAGENIGTPEILGKYLHPEEQMPEKDYLALGPEEMLSLDYDGKLKLLDAIVGRMLELRLPMVQAKSRVAELGADFAILKEVKSAVQSSIKSEYR